MAGKRNGNKKKPRPALSEAELKRLLDQPNVSCTTGLRDWTMMQIMAQAGLRVSEVVALRRSDIVWGSDQERPMIRVIEGKGNTDRNVWIDRQLRDILRLWDKERYGYARTFFYTTRATATGAVQSAKHGALSTRTVQQMIKNCAAAAGLPTTGRRRVTPHTLRTTYTTTLIRDGVKLPAIQKLLGHASLSTTQLYEDLQNTDVSEEVWLRGEGQQEQQTLDGQPTADELALVRKLRADPELARLLAGTTD